MLRDITIGQYFPVSSPIHRMDPRFKILAAFLYVFSLFIIKDIAAYSLIVLFLGVTIKTAKVPLKYIMRGLKPILFIIFFAFAINIFLTPGEIFTQIGPVTVTYEGIHQAFFMAFRLMFLIVGTSLLTLTTSPIELTDGLEVMLSPFRKIGLPAHELAMMMSIALRFIPTLLAETDKIMKAQMARGADFETGNLLKRAQSLIPLLVPLFISAFRRADELAMAMEARCYRGGDNRTRMKILRYTRNDAVGAAVMVAYVSMLVAWRVFL